MQQSQGFSFPWPSPQTTVGLAPTPKTKLFSTLKIRDLTLNNRIVVSPMCQYSSKDGYWNDWHLVQLGRYAMGGAGLIFTEATAVEDIGRITPYCTGLWSDDQKPGLKKIVDFVHAHGSAIGIQIAHAGRKASTYQPWVNRGNAVPLSDGGWTPIGPSPIPYNQDYHTPTEMTKEDIARVVKLFKDTTVRAVDAGVDVIEIHGAHGYLISSFNSPLTNKRTDEYGGSFEGRTRLCVEVVNAVRSVMPKNMPLFLRLSCVDWVEGGWSSEDTVKLAGIVKDLGVDVVDCSSAGNLHEQKIAVAPGFQVPFSQDIKKKYPELLTAAVGLINDPHQAEHILQQGSSDLIALAREFIVNPQWPIQAASELGEVVHNANQFGWALYWLSANKKMIEEEKKKYKPENNNNNN
eukprot:TRINITY_DN12181_c0_g1_i1.p1 TRINITY_DN12181_c0_g1~~TRINITY_DN12181_c0_g1_i1.p1  ORF type:complete len:406 (+),score=103.06 TRINITY_DN12181_c0_g1_i1:201-1418(+)